MKLKTKLFRLTAIAAIASFSFSAVASADYNVGGRTSAIFNAYYDSSVATYGYTLSFDTGRTSWGGISSKVAIGKTTSASGLPDKYYVGTTSDPSLMGSTSYFDANSNQVYPTDLRAFSTVSLYQNNLVNYDSSYRTSTAIHEIGHSVSLKHTSDVFLNSVMLSFLQNIGVQQYDKDQLKAKWGI